MAQIEAVVRPAAVVVPSLGVPSNYKDRSFRGSDAEWLQALNTSTTLYIGNLSFYTSEEQILELFSTIGEVKRIIMGLDRFNKSPCGFCFVEYHDHDDALAAVIHLNGTKLDERGIRVDLDPGYQQDRHLGRGKGGGQVRDYFRADFDAGRGGWGALEKQRQGQVYDDVRTVPQGASSGAGMGGYGGSSYEDTDPTRGPPPTRAAAAPRTRTRRREDSDDEEAPPAAEDHDDAPRSKRSRRDDDA